MSPLAKPIPDPYQDLPEAIYLGEQVRTIDHSAINDHGIPGYELMHRAAKFSFDYARRRWPESSKWVIFCGQGNNAADGYIVAGLAKSSGLDVTIVYLSAPEELSGDAQKAYEFAQSKKVPLRSFSEHMNERDMPEHHNPDLFVDALFGIGLNKPLKGDYLEAVEYCNSLSIPTLSLDIPSGLSANTGQALGAAILADGTTTYIGLKLGLFTGQGRNYSGEISLSDLNVPNAAIKQIKPEVSLINLTRWPLSMPPRAKAAHKGRSGHTLLVGGNAGYGGAIILSATTCARSGSGLTSVATHQQTVSAILSSCPELMPKGIEDAKQLDILLQHATFIAIGPGLSRSDWASSLLERCLKHALKHQTPMLLDADALNLIAQSSKNLLQKLGGRTILTPHPGEAARLLDTTVADIESDRLAAVRQLCQKYNSIVVLKGSGTLVGNPNGDIALCPYGNPGMASGGMGDVLTGLIASLASQSIAPKKEACLASKLWNATCLGVTLHARAADIEAQQKGERGLLASDLIPSIRRLVNGLT